MTRTSPLPSAPVDPPAPAARPDGQAVLREPPLPENLSPDLRLVIEEDAASKTYIYKTVNRLTGEVLKQFPREQVLKLNAESGYQPGRIVSTGA